VGFLFEFGIVDRFEKALFFSVPFFDDRILVAVFRSRAKAFLAAKIKRYLFSRDFEALHFKTPIF
jgi:hypothetical protein